MYTGFDSFILKDDFLCSSDDCKSLKMPINYEKGNDYMGNSVYGLLTNINWYNPSGGKFGTSNKSLKNALTHSSSAVGDFFPKEIIKNVHQALCTGSLPSSASWPAVNMDGPTQA